MDHLSPEQVVRYLDDRLPPEEAAEIEEHLERCPSCRSRVSGGRRVSDRLEEAVQRRNPPTELGKSGGMVGGTMNGLRTAAVLAVLLVGGGAAADVALPGTPVQDWLRTVVGMTSAPQVAAERGAIGIPLHRGSISIRITEAPPGVPIRIRFVDQREALVSARGGSFRTGEGQLTLVNPARDTIKVLVPRAVDSVDIRSNGHTLLEKNDSRARARGTGNDSLPSTLVITIPDRGKP